MPLWKNLVSGIALVNLRCKQKPGYFYIISLCLMYMILEFGDLYVYASFYSRIFAWLNFYWSVIPGFLKAEGGYCTVSTHINLSCHERLFIFKVLRQQIVLKCFFVKNCLFAAFVETAYSATDSSHRQGAFPKRRIYKVRHLGCGILLWSYCLSLLLLLLPASWWCKYHCILFCLISAGCWDEQSPEASFIWRCL